MGEERLEHSEQKEELTYRAEVGQSLTFNLQGGAATGAPCCIASLASVIPAVLHTETAHLQHRHRVLERHSELTAFLNFNLVLVPQNLDFWRPAYLAFVSGKLILLHDS